MNINLVLLKNKAADLFSRVEVERDSHKSKIADLQSDATKKVRTQWYIDGQVRHEQKQAKEVAARYHADLKSVEASIAKVQGAWSTPALMARAKPYNDDADVNTRILAELEQARAIRNIERARPIELIDLLKTAAATGNLVALNLLKTEIGRRDFSDSVERMKVNTALADAIAGVKIEGQEQAHAAVEQATMILEAAQDVLIEIETGKEPLRAQARRVGAEYAAREQEKTEA
jgi:hypothetical protein